MKITIPDMIWQMHNSLTLALKAYSMGEVPVGAICLNADGRVVAEKHNLKESNYDPCGHAEILALREAARLSGNWRLTGHTLVVTLEPCLMCFQAMVLARIDTLIFGAYDPKGGTLSLGYLLHKDKRLNHNFSVIGGILGYECSQILSQFFKERRPKKLSGGE